MFQYNPETRCQSTEWETKSLRPKVFCLQKSMIKIMLIFLFHKQGVIHKKLVPDGKIVNSEFYIQMLERLLKGISRVRPQFWKKGSWSLMYNSALGHSTITLNCSLGNCSTVREATHPVHLTSYQTIFLFPYVKTALKDRRFQDVKDI